MASDLRYADTYWELQIENLAKQKMLGVTVTVPGGFVVAEIKRGASSQFMRKKDAQVAVGDLLPGDVVTVYAWSSDYSLNSMDRLRVAHAAGLARMKRRYLVNRSWYKVAEFFSIMGWVGIALCAFSALILFGAYWGEKSQPPHSAGHLTPAPTTSATPAPRE